MANTATQSVKIDLYPDGLMVVWTPAGPKSTFSPNDMGKLLSKLCKIKPENMQPPKLSHNLTTNDVESIDEFLARGGAIKRVPSNVPKEVPVNLSLDDLSL